MGSILGPILFLLYVNHIPEVMLKSLLFMFADDSKCLKVINSLDDCLYLQSDLDRLYRWALANELFFQPPERHNLRISRKRFSFQREQLFLHEMLTILARFS